MINWTFVGIYIAILVANQLVMITIHYKKVRALEDLAHESAKCICILMNERDNFIKESKNKSCLTSYKPPPKVEKLYPEKKDDDATS